MRLFNNERKVLIIQKKKIFLVIFLLFCIVLVFFLNRATKVYTSELRQMMKIKSNNIFQQIVNTAVMETCKNNEYKFIDIVYNDGKVVSVDYNSTHINTFKAEVTDKIIKNIDNKKCRFKIYFADALKNPIMLNKGPYFETVCSPISGVKINCFSKFEDAGVNQTKNSIWFEISLDIYATGGMFNTVNSFKYSVAVSETVIVGEAPESYTNVTGDADTKDTVLNLQ